MKFKMLSFQVFSGNRGTKKAIEIGTDLSIYFDLRYFSLLRELRHNGEIFTSVWAGEAENEQAAIDQYTDVVAQNEISMRALVKSRSIQLPLKTENFFFYVLYKYPKDFPNDIVLRPWNFRDGIPGSEHIFESIDAAQRWCRSLGLVCLPRHPDDDPVIVETWV